MIYIPSTGSSHSQNPCIMMTTEEASCLQTTLVGTFSRIVALRGSVFSAVFFSARCCDHGCRLFTEACRTLHASVYPDVKFHTGSRNTRILACSHVNLMAHSHDNTSGKPNKLPVGILDALEAKGPHSTSYTFDLSSRRRLHFW